MKMIALVLLLLPSVPAFASKKPKVVNPADYPVAVHVITSHNGDVEAVIEGQTVELKGSTGNQVQWPLALGDYKAQQIPVRYVSNVQNGHDTIRAYEFLFSDGSTRYYQVVGFVGSESCAPGGTNPAPSL